MSVFFRALSVSLALAISASRAAGQQSSASPDIMVTPPPGWSLTPAMGVSQTWDDNVTLKGHGDNPVSDMINVVNPRAELNFTGSAASWRRATTARSSSTDRRGR